MYFPEGLENTPFNQKSIGKATERNLQLKLTIAHNLHAHMSFSFIKILEDIVILKKFEAKF